MGTLEQLAAQLLLGGQGQEEEGSNIFETEGSSQKTPNINISSLEKLVAQENPYYMINSGTSAAMNAAQEYLKPLGVDEESGRYVVRDTYSDALPWALGAGVLQGVLSGFGDDYQGTLQNRYLEALSGQEPSGYLPGKLFSNAKTQAQLFGQRNQGPSILEREERKAKNDLTKEIVSKIMENPRNASKALPLIQNLGLFGSPKQRTIVDEDMEFLNGGATLEPAARTSQEPTRGLEGVMLDDIKAEANRLMDEGATPAQAYQTARDIYGSKKGELDRQYKRIEDAEKAGQEAKTFVSQLQLALQGAGDTGKFGSLKQGIAGLLGEVGVEGQGAKYAAGQDVETFSNEAVKQFGRAFKGPMSDRDVQIMLRAAPSLTTEEATNQAILDRWNFAAELQLAYADFMRGKQSQGVPVAEAESQWTAIRNKNPYVVKVGGKYEINPAWLTGELNLADAPQASSQSSGSGSPPAGYEFTGRVDSQGRKGIRKK